MAKHRSLVVVEPELFEVGLYNSVSAEVNKLTIVGELDKKNVRLKT